MAKVIYAPKDISKLDKMSIFLAGTIGIDGGSPDWQKDITEKWDKFDVTFLNPRRPDWDENFGSDEVIKQVKWELDAMDKADVIIVNILDDSKSPITIAETYRHAGSRKLFVACSDKFYRYDNIKAVCEHYESALFDSWEELCEFMESHMEDLIDLWEVSNT